MVEHLTSADAKKYLEEQFSDPGKWYEDGEYKVKEFLYYNYVRKDRHNPKGYVDIPNVLRTIYKENLAKAKKEAKATGNKYRIETDSILQNIVASFLHWVFPEGKDVYSGGHVKYEAAIAGTKGQYPYIPSTTYHIINFVRNYPQFAKGKFLDIGCGVGDKVFLYNWLTGKPAAGLEYDYCHVQIALNKIRNIYPYEGHYVHSPKQRKFITGLKFHWGDATKWNRFSEFNVFYTYIPMTDRVMLEQLYRQAATQAAKDSIWAEVGDRWTFEKIMKECGWRRIENQPFFTKM